jgi:hypothetical protein
MFRSVCCSAILAIVLGAGLSAQRIQLRVPPNPKAGPPRQAAVIERWAQMSPEQRNKALAKLPPERRQRIEQLLNQYQNLSPEERQQLRFRSEMFNQLPPEKQDIARRMFRQFNLLPPERQALVREEFQSLHAMSEPDRRARVQSDDFRGKFDPREQQFLRQFSRLLSPAP